MGKDLYRQLGEKIDGLAIRTPWNETLRAILEELYSEEDARLIVGMPYSLSRLERVEQVSGVPRSKLQAQLESLADRGLVLDLHIGGETFYAPSPYMVGIYEFTMMRSGAVDKRKLAGLFKEYYEGAFLAGNVAPGYQISLMRTLPWEGTQGDHVEVLDYEKATALVESSSRFAMATCSCRHEREHLGGRDGCKAPLDNCSMLGPVAADYGIRHGLAREVSKTEMLENVARSRELGLVINADNVQRNGTFLCHCCGCCCVALQAISKLGYTRVVVTSSYIAASDHDVCKGCGVCSRRCPIDAIPRVADPDPRFRKHGRPRVNEELCIGCGVCALRCRSGAMKLRPRPQRVLHPETTFERALLQSLQNGTLQNQLFDDPTSKTQAFLRGVVGGFLRLPAVKQALMRDTLRSRFLGALRSGVRQQGRAAITEF